MALPTKVRFPSFMLQISGELYTPANSSPNRKGAAIVVSHPMTGVKEQTSADYARALSATGFYALTFDAGYQGESTGEPRGLEDPVQRVEDIKAAVTYLTTLQGTVDPTRIGVLGICASGGYASYATQSDTRIRALATVSAACVGRMTRSGGLHEEQNRSENLDAIAGTLKVASEWRTNESVQHHEAPKMFSTDVTQLPEDADSFFKDAAAYYGTARGRHERSDQRVPPMSYDLMVCYDSFSAAQTLHYSKTAIDDARDPKQLFVVQGKNHFDLYDDVTEAAPKLVDFFGNSL